jgi:diguanylate cyclase (GGDEF)-like protein
MDVASESMRNLPGATELTDTITGLPKPAALDTHLYLALMRSRAAGTQVAVVVADVDDFSSIVVQRGWSAGDEVLAQVAERFRSCLRDDDMVVRMFGDVFAGVCEEITDTKAVDLVMGRLARAFARPFVVGGAAVDLHVSIGSSLSSTEASRPEQLLAGAEGAMRRNREAAGSAT